MEIPNYSTVHVLDYTYKQINNYIYMYSYEQMEVLFSPNWFIYPIKSTISPVKNLMVLVSISSHISVLMLNCTLRES